MKVKIQSDTLRQGQAQPKKAKASSSKKSAAFGPPDSIAQGQQYSITVLGQSPARPDSTAVPPPPLLHTMAPRLPSRCWSACHLQQRTSQFLLPHLDTAALRRPTISPSAGPSSSSSHLLLPRTTTRGVKYGWSNTLPKRGSKATRFNQVTAGLPAPTAGPAAALKRKENTTPVRAGVVAIKKGMTALFSRRGTRIPCTVLQLDSVQVLLNKTRENAGYFAVQVGAVPKRPSTALAPQLGYFEAKGVEPKQHVAEFRVRNEQGLLPVGVQLQPDWFHVGQWVDVRGTSRGMGFEGGMKRHGFSGQNKSHGNSLNHRTGGSVGPSQGSGSRVHPGKKMPGRMGGQSATAQNLSVLKVDNDLGIVVVKGAVAGPKGGMVKIQDAVLKPPPPEKWIRESLETLMKRHPNHDGFLEAARARHLELKEARRTHSVRKMVSPDQPRRNRLKPDPAVWGELAQL
ncbi:50S ribosomal protein L3 [Pyricularia oryzae Y34]|nr:50S ribosomal protein L3 [Pyricularia oryzae Y34]